MRERRKSRRGRGSVCEKRERANNFQHANFIAAGQGPETGTEEQGDENDNNELDEEGNVKLNAQGDAPATSGLAQAAQGQ